MTISLKNNSLTHWQGWVWQGEELPSGLQEQQITAPTLAADEVLVKNAAIALNPVDWKLLDAMPGQVPGVDGAGVVVAAGSEQLSGLIGQRVAYHQNLQAAGSFAQYTPLKAQVVMRIPDAMSFSDAAAFPCPGLTAWQTLEKIAARPGARVLISGAGGAVGRFLVQLATQRGFEVTTLSHPRHHEILRQLGANQCLDNSQTDKPALPESLVAGFYAVIDAISPERALALQAGVEANGHLVCIQGRLEAWPNPAFGRAISMHEVALGALHQHGNAQQWQALTRDGEQLLAAIASGSLQGETVRTAGWDQLPAQLLALKHRSFSGKPVIIVE